MVYGHFNLFLFFKILKQHKPKDPKQMSTKKPYQELQKKDKNQRTKHKKEKKKMTNHVLCTWFLFFFFVHLFLSRFLPNLRRKYFGGLGEKTPKPLQFSLQSNTHKTHFLSTFLSHLFQPKISPTKQTLKNQPPNCSIDCC